MVIQLAPMPIPLAHAIPVAVGAIITAVAYAFGRWSRRHPSTGLGRAAWVVGLLAAIIGGLDLWNWELATRLAPLSLPSPDPIWVSAYPPEHRRPLPGIPATAMVGRTAFRAQRSRLGLCPGLLARARLCLSDYRGGALLRVPGWRSSICSRPAVGAARRGLHRSAPRHAHPPAHLLDALPPYSPLPLLQWAVHCASGPQLLLPVDAVHPADGSAADTRSLVSAVCSL